MLRFAVMNKAELEALAAVVTLIGFGLQFLFWVLTVRRLRAAMEWLAAWTKNGMVRAYALGVGVLEGWGEDWDPMTGILMEFERIEEPALEGSSPRVRYEPREQPPPERKRPRRSISDRRSNTHLSVVVVLVLVCLAAIGAVAWLRG